MPLNSLTSLRFFAALLVVVSHLRILEYSDSSFIRALYGHIFFEGYIGVTFFFILSGFILSYSYGEKITKTKVEFLDFIINRVARIFPLHLLTLLMALPLSVFAVLNIPETIWIFLAKLFVNIPLLQSFVPNEKFYFSMNAPSWSLSVEMFFYALFPVLVMLKTRWIFILIFLILIYQQIVSLLGVKDVTHFLVYVFPPSRLADFLSGILVFRLYKSRESIPSAAASYLQAVSILLLIGFFALKGNISQASRYDAYYIVPMSFVILSFAWQNGYFSRLISNKLFVFLGEASFALYLIHQIVISYGEIIRLKIFKMNISDNVVMFSITYLILSIFISAMLFLYFEKKAKLTVLTILRQWRIKRQMVLA